MSTKLGPLQEIKPKSNQTFADYPVDYPEDPAEDYPGDYPEDCPEDSSDIGRFDGGDTEEDTSIFTEEDAKPQRLYDGPPWEEKRGEM